MPSEEADLLKQLDDENGRLKKLVPAPALGVQILKKVAWGN